MSEDDTRFDVGRTERRSILKALGALGFAGLGPAVTETTALEAQNSGSDFRKPRLARTYADAAQFQNRSKDLDFQVGASHSLLYFGANWDPVTSPGSGRGAWQHTFALSSFGLTGLLDHNTQEYDRTIDPNNEATGGKGFEGFGFTIARDEETDPTEIAWAARYDEDFYAYIDPREMVDKLDNREDLQSLLSGMGDEISASPSLDDYGTFGLTADEMNQIEERREAANEALTHGLLFSLNLLAVRSGSNLGELAVALLDVLADVSMRDLLDGDFDFYDGFHEYRELPGPGAGTIFMFDLYVPAGVEPTFTVESKFDLHYDPDWLPVKEDTGIHDTPHPYTTEEILEENNFQTAPEWRVSIGALPAPDDPTSYAVPGEATAEMEALSDHMNDGWVALQPESHTVRPGEPLEFEFAYSGRAVAETDWEFGDGSDRDITWEPVEHTYSETGTYTVRLTAEMLSGQRYADSATIDVVPRPAITLNPEFPEATQTAEFDLEHMEDVAVTGLSWDFGDGTTDDPGHRPIDHVFEEEGTYTVQATIETEEGQTYEPETTVEVQPGEGHDEVDADIVANDPLVTDAPIEFEATNQKAPNGWIETFEWAADGGKRDSCTRTEDYSPISCTTWETSFDSTGEHEISVRLTDNGGETATVTKAVQIDANDGLDVTASVNEPAGPIRPRELVTFGAEVEGASSGVERTWIMPDATTVTKPTPTYRFDEVGSYDVEVTARDEYGASGTDTVTVEVVENDGPAVTIENAPSTLAVDETGTFEANGSDPEGDTLSYEWEFPAGEPLPQTKEGATTTFSWPEPGGFVVTVTVTDAYGGTATAETTVEVEPDNAAPQASASASTTSALTGQAVEFTGTATDPDGNVTSYRWDFGDGTSASGATPSHTYDTTGYHTVELTVEDAYGLTDTDSVTVFVSENSSPTVSIDSAPSTITVGDTANLSASGSDPDGHSLTYKWSLPDGTPLGTTKTGPDVSHTWNTAGSFRLEVTVSDGHGGTDSAATTLEVEAGEQDPTLSMHVPDTASTGEKVELTAYGSDPDGGSVDFLWDIETSGLVPATKSGSSVTFTWKNSGTYDVTCYVTDDEGTQISKDRDITIK